MSRGAEWIGAGCEPASPTGRKTRVARVHFVRRGSLNAWRAAVWVAGVTALFGGVGASATATTLDSGDSEVRGRGEGAGELTSLSLNQASREALAANYDYLVSRSQLESQVRATGAARGAFRPSLSLSTDYRDAGETPLTLEGSPRQMSYGGSLSWSTPVGTDLTVSSSAHGPVDGGAVEGSAVAFSIRQPLLKGLGRRGAGVALSFADVDEERQRQIFRAAGLDLLVNVEAAYWQVAFAEAGLAVSERSRERARVQFEDTGENIRRGILAEAEIHLVEENLVFFDEQLVRARETLALAHSDLAQLLRRSPGTVFALTDPLEIRGELAEPPLAEATARALAQSPDLARDELDVRRAELELAYQKNLGLPSLDLSASLGLTRADDGQGSGGWVRGGEPLDAQVGLEFGLPLFRGPVGDRVARAKLGLEQEELRRDQGEARLRFEVRDLLTSMASAGDRLDLARRRVRLGELKLEAEVDKYENGISTLDGLVRFQRDLDGAVNSARRIELERRLAESRFWAAQGTLFQVRGLEGP